MQIHWANSGTNNAFSEEQEQQTNNLILAKAVKYEQ